ncbi:MAG: ErfK/YbiS/YcfS/YnhG family protein [Actinobacteria bacterium]|nr:ErfK/YbiS/YcfS/YnhG family protein [Actinomycetota bacterium]
MAGDEPKAGPKPTVATRTLIGGVAVIVVALILALTGLAVFRGGSPGRSRHVVAAPTPTPTATASPSDTPSTSPTATSDAPVETGPPPGSLGPPPPGDPVPSSSTVVYLNGPATVQVYGAPDAAKRTSTLRGRNSIDQPSAFLVLDHQPGWFHVLLPVEPNGSTGWLKASDVQVAATTDYLRVTVSQFRIDHYVAGKWHGGFRVAVGKPSTPTPTGLFYILASQQVDQAPYTPGIFALSGFAPQPIPGFLGATLGVHGWTDPSVIGTRASNGCVRLMSKDMEPLLRTLILGTPVDIVA